MFDAAERHLDLLLNHSAVLAAKIHQFLMRTGLQNLSVFNDDDQVRTRDRTQPMRDDKACATFHQSSETLLNQLLAFRIQVTCGFVQNQ